MFSVKRGLSCCLLPLGVIVLCFSIFMGYFIIPGQIHQGIIKESKLVQSDNPRYNAWQKVPIRLYQNIYLFNVTNPEHVGHGEKPQLQQLGPYVFEMKLEKFGIVFNEENGTFFYRERIDYFFRPEMSNGSESDPIYFVNLPYVNAAQDSQRHGDVARYVVQQIMSDYSHEAKLYLHTTVGRLLFGGIPLGFMKELSNLQGTELLPNNTFGILYGQNGTDQGRFEVDSGQKHEDMFGKIVSWNGQSELAWWSHDSFCKKINGTDGVFAPFATEDSTIFMFMPGMCRSFPLTYEKHESPVFGVPVMKFSVPSSFLANPSDNPDNQCYFTEVEKPYPDSGVFPLRGCGRASMMLSQPHFYQASSSYLNQSEGLSPEQDKHEMAMLVEPYTGTPMRTKVRFQMNIDIVPNKKFKPLKRVPKVMHPLFWMEQISQVPEKDADTIRNKLIVTLKIISIVIHSLMLLGIALILISLILTFFCHKNQCQDVATSEDVVVSPRNKKLLRWLVSLTRPVSVHLQKPQSINRVVNDAMSSKNSKEFPDSDMKSERCVAIVEELVPFVKK